MKKLLNTKNRIKAFLSEITVEEWLGFIFMIILLLVIIAAIIDAFCYLSNPVMNTFVYVDPDTGVNYIKINNDHWMPRYDSDGNIVVTIITEEAE